MTTNIKNLPAVVVEEERSLAAIVTWTPEQVQLVKDTVCRGADDNEFKIFCYTCKRTGLDPFARQIYAIKRYDAQLEREVMTVQTGIDGYRVIADRNGYAGQDSPQLAFEQPGDRQPTSATVTVYRLVAGQRVAFSHTAYWDEYVQLKKDGTMTRFWSKMPKNQLAKCAEAGALRKAFPNDLSGIYTTDEMAQADNPEPTTASKPAPSRKAAPQQQQQSAPSGQGIWPVGKNKGMAIADLDPDYLQWVINNMDKQDLRNMAQAELDRRAGGGDVTEPPVDNPNPSLIEQIEAAEIQVWGADIATIRKNRMANVGTMDLTELSVAGLGTLKKSVVDQMGT